MLLEKHAHRAELHAASTPGELHNEAVELYEMDASTGTTRQHTPEPLPVKMGAAGGYKTPTPTVAQLVQVGDVEVSPETRTYDTLQRANLSPVSDLTSTFHGRDVTWGMRLDEFEQPGRPAEEPAPAYSDIHSPGRR